MITVQENTKAFSLSWLSNFTLWLLFLFPTFEEASSEDKDEPGDVLEVYYLEEIQGLSGTE